MARYRVLRPQQWLDTYAPDAPPHPFGLSFLGPDGEPKRYEEGDVIADFPRIADVASYIAQGWVEELTDGQ